jgi:hypothetical protein
VAGGLVIRRRLATCPTSLRELRRLCILTFDSSGLVQLADLECCKACPYYCWGNAAKAPI